MIQLNLVHIFVNNFFLWGCQKGMCISLLLETFHEDLGPNRATPTNFHDFVIMAKQQRWERNLYFYNISFLFTKLKSFLCPGISSNCEKLSFMLLIRFDPVHMRTTLNDSSHQFEQVKTHWTLSLRIIQRYRQKFAIILTINFILINNGNIIRFKVYCN